MTGLIVLVNGGQDYIVFDVACSVIQGVEPSGKKGWIGTKILNKSFAPGEVLKIDLQWDDYDLPLKYLIKSVEVQEIEGGEWLRANMSKEKKLYVNPRTGDDLMMYKVNCKGIPFYFGCLNYAAVAAAEAVLNVDKIPAALMEDVDGVMLFDDIKPGRPETIADLGDFFMVIYNNRIVDYGVITHEATHAWAYDKWGTYTPPADTDFMAAIRSGEPTVTEYAKTSAAEDLAETVRFYVVDREMVMRVAPLRYESVHRMMTDPAYRG